MNFCFPREEVFKSGPLQFSSCSDQKSLEVGLDVSPGMSVSPCSLYTKCVGKGCVCVHMCGVCGIRVVCVHMCGVWCMWYMCGVVCVVWCVMWVLCGVVCGYGVWYVCGVGWSVW